MCKQLCFLAMCITLLLAIPAWADPVPDEHYGSLILGLWGWKLIVSECIIILIEAVVLLLTLQIVFLRSLFTSLIANFASFIIGDIFNTLLYPSMPTRWKAQLGIVFILVIIVEAVVIFLMNRNLRFKRVIITSAVMNTVTLLAFLSLLTLLPEW
jgi:hypothetical protein